MSQLNKYLELLKHLRADIRLEVIVVDLIQADLRLDDVMVISNSLFKRNYHHDIETIEEIEYGKSKKSRLGFVVNRSGLYDNLPEDIFHQVGEPAKSSAWKAEDDINEQQELEKFSRKFFLPYEQEFYRHRIKLETEERNFLFETNSDISGDLFNNLWNFPDIFSSLQKSKLGVLMPVLNRMVGDYRLAAFIIKNISGNYVEIEETSPLTYTVENRCRLNYSQLGVDSILGGVVTEMQPSLIVKIFVKDYENLLEYLVDGKKAKIFQFLCNLLVPLESDIQYELFFEDHEKELFKLDIENQHTGRLNYTTVI